MNAIEKVQCPNLSYASMIGAVRREVKQKKDLEKKFQHLSDKLLESQTEYVKLLDAQKLLSTVSDDNTERTLSFITQMVNKTLQEVFVFNGRSFRIELENKLYAGSKPHIKLKLIDDRGMVYTSLDLQTGYGILQVISFMYSLCLIEIRKGRRLLIVGERLNGLHAEAKRVISDIIKIFSDNDFQFIFVEYTLNDLGKIYNVERRGDDSILVDLEGKPYNDSIVQATDISDADLSILDKDYVDEEGEAE